ncbi:hypothetical protein M1N44_03920, partial [Dehalococcoidia bacterium]|nr:hypothetical protein [Dehalococcoidia bacterium]
VCDYLDFVVAPEREADFFNTLLTSLAESGIVSLKLLSLRPDSTVLTSLARIARERGLASPWVFRWNLICPPPGKNILRC